MKISIITPNYNYSNYISKTIESVVNQTYQNWEYIIVDDGSTDNSVEVVKQYSSKYPDKIKLIQQKNKGQTNAINEGLKHASGAIIGWINSDDMYYDKYVLEIIISCFKSDRNLEAIFGNMMVIDQQGNSVKTIKYPKFNYISGVFNGFGKIIPSNAIFWKKKLTDDVGYLDEKFDHAMDSEYWSRLLLNRKVLKINKTLAKFRWHSQAKTIKRKNTKSSQYSIARKEDDLVRKNAYNYLILAKYLPYKYSKFLKYFYRLKRYTQMFLKGHYIK